MIFRHRPIQQNPNAEEDKEPNYEYEGLGLSKYLRLLSEGKISDKEVDPHDLESLKRLSKHYKFKIHKHDMQNDDIAEEIEGYDDIQSTSVVKSRQTIDYNTGK